MQNMIRISGVILIAILIQSCQKEADNVIKDTDGNVYTSVTIGTQVWMVENLKTTSYRNGDIIGTTTPAALDISGEITPKYQWPPRGDEQLAAEYGRLYSWYSVTDSRNLCPVGWHIPSDAEFTVLTDYLINNGYGNGGSGSDIAKSMASRTSWTTVPAEGEIGNDNSNNSSGFTAVPGGYRYNYMSFTDIGIICHWWTSTEYNSDNAFFRELHYGESDIFAGAENKRASACSVRCIKD